MIHICLALHIDRAPSRLSPYTGLVVLDDVEEISYRRRRPKPSVMSLLPAKDVWLYDLIYDPYLGPPKRDFTRDSEQRSVRSRYSGKIRPRSLMMESRVE